MSVDSPTLNPTTGVVDVPAGPDNAVKSTPALPSDAEAASVRMVRDLFLRARDARRPMIAEWKTLYRVLNNRSWKPGGESWEPRSDVPQIWPVVASRVAWMTDQRPTLQVMAGGEMFSPHNDFYDQISRDMNALLESNFVVHSQDAEITKMLWDVDTYGIGWMKTIWDATLAGGLGDSDFQRCDPFTIYPDPFARSSRDMNYVIEAKTMTLSSLDRAWPGSAKALGHEGWIEDADEAPHRLDESTNRSAPRALIAPPSPGGSYASQRTGRQGVANMSNREEAVVTVLECWVRDHKVTKTPDADVMRVEEIWRVYIVCGNRLLFTGTAEDVSGFSTHPFDRCVSMDTGEMYGPSLVSMMKSPQESINRIVSSIERNTILVGNPILAESPRSQSQNQRMSNRPGSRIKASPSEVGWLQPPQMQPQMSVSLLTYFESKIESISGMSAMVRGFSPSGRNSQGVLDSVQDAAFVRVRANLRELERCLRGVTWKMAANISEFYTEPRMQAIIGQDGQQTRRALAARHFYTRGDKRVPLEFTILADAGSQLPTSKQARSAEADTLFALGAIDVYELLKAKQWPSYSVVAKRVMEMQTSGALQPPGQRQAARA